MGPIRDLNLSYEALNDRGTFSEGDTLAGTLSFTLTKETTIKSLFVKAKGDAHVEWREGNEPCPYSAHRRYFKLKELLIEEIAEGTVLSQGIHLFNFSFKIPEGAMPSSFRGLFGRIVYTLEAKVSRSWLFPSKVKQEISFVSKCIPQQPDKVMCPQSGSVNKETGVFSKEQVQLSATVDRRFCSPGDTLSIVAKIYNASSKTMRPKFKLQQVTMYRADGSTNDFTKTLCKLIGRPILSKSIATAPCRLQIPSDAIHTLFNCEIISVDYHVKVYLDISFDIDPEVVFPLIIIPSFLLNPPYPGGATGGQSSSDFPPPAFPAEPQPAHMGPRAVELNHRNVPPPGAFGGPCPAGGFGAPTNSDFPPGAFAGPYSAFSGPNHSNFPPPRAFRGPCPAGGFGAPTNSDYPPPGAFAGPYPAVGAGGPSNSNFPPPGAFAAPNPAGGFGGPVNSGFPAPGVSGGPYPPSPNLGYYGFPGAQSCPAPPAASPNNPPAYAGPPAVSPPQPADMSGSYSTPAPVFPPHSVQPPSYFPLSNTSSAPAAYNVLPSTPMKSMDFLSQKDEAPVAFSVPPLPSDAKKTDNKE